MRSRTRRIIAEDELPAGRVLGRCEAEAFADRKAFRPLPPRLNRDLRRIYAGKRGYQEGFVSRKVRTVGGQDARGVDQPTGRVGIRDEGFSDPPAVRTHAEIDIRR